MVRENAQPEDKFSVSPLNERLDSTSRVDGYRELVFQQPEGRLVRGTGVEPKHSIKMHLSGELDEYVKGRAVQIISQGIPLEDVEFKTEMVRTWVRIRVMQIREDALSPNFCEALREMTLRNIDRVLRTNTEIPNFVNNDKKVEEDIAHFESIVAMAKKHDLSVAAHEELQEFLSHRGGAKRRSRK